MHLSSGGGGGGDPWVAGIGCGQHQLKALVVWPDSKCSSFSVASGQSAARRKRKKRKRQKRKRRKRMKFKWTLSRLIICSSFLFLLLGSLKLFQFSDCFDFSPTAPKVGQPQPPPPPAPPVELKEVDEEEEEEDEINLMIDSLKQQLESGPRKRKNQTTLWTLINNIDLIPSQMNEPQMVTLGRLETRSEMKRKKQFDWLDKDEDYDQQHDDQRQDQHQSRQTKKNKKTSESHVQGDSSIKSGGSSTNVERRRRIESTDETSGIVVWAGSDNKHGGRWRNQLARAGANGRSGQRGNHWLRGHSKASRQLDAADYDLQSVVGHFHVAEMNKQSAKLAARRERQRPPPGPDLSRDNDKNVTTFINDRLHVGARQPAETMARRAAVAAAAAAAAEEGDHGGRRMGPRRRRRRRKRSQQNGRQDSSLWLARQDNEMLADDKLANLMSFNSQQWTTTGAPSTREEQQTSGHHQSAPSDTYTGGGGGGGGGQQSVNLDLGHAFQGSTSEPGQAAPLSPLDYFSSSVSSLAAGAATNEAGQFNENNEPDQREQQQAEASEEGAYQSVGSAEGQQQASESNNHNNDNNNDNDQTSNGLVEPSCESVEEIKRALPSLKTGVLFGINYGIVFVCGLLGNVISLYVLIRKGKKCTCQDILIANLACSDIMLCVFAVPITPKYLISDGYWTLGAPMCKVVSFAQSTSVYMSTYSLICIGYIRYRLIIYPLEESMSKRTALYSCLGTWLVGIIVTLPLMLQVRLSPEQCEVKFCDEAWPYPWRFIFSLFTAFFQFMIPLACVAFFNKKIYSRLDGRRHTNTNSNSNSNTNNTTTSKSMAYKSPSGSLANRGGGGPPTSSSTGNNSNHKTCQQRLDVIAIKEQRQRDKEKRMRKANNRLIFVVVVFAHSWLPLNIYNIAQDYFQEMSTWAYLTPCFLTVHLIACSSVCWNPILYAWMSECYRQDLRNALPAVIISRLRCLREPGHHWSQGKHNKHGYQQHSGCHSTSTLTHNNPTTHSTFVSSSAATGSSALSAIEMTTNIDNNNTNNTNINNNNNNITRRQLTTICSHPMEQQQQLELDEINNNNNNNSLIICYNNYHQPKDDHLGQVELGDLVSVRQQRAPNEELEC